MQQKHVTCPLQEIEWWATKTRYMPPTRNRMVGNKNTLPAPYI